MPPNMEAAGTSKKPFEEVHLYDIQGLFGGQNLYIRNDGSLFVRVIRPSDTGLSERRFKGVLEAAEIVKLSHLMESVDFEHLSMSDRQGIPDEARPTIILFKENRIISKAKWANDFHEGFDEIYGFLNRIVRLQEKTAFYFEGRFDHHFHPQGFRKPE